MIRMFIAGIVAQQLVSGERHEDSMYLYGVLNDSVMKKKTHPLALKSKIARNACFVLRTLHDARQADRICSFILH